MFPGHWYFSVEQSQKNFTDRLNTHCANTKQQQNKKTKTQLSSLHSKDSLNDRTALLT